MLKTFTDNPVPAALVGLGLYWLLKNSSNGSEDALRHYPSKSTQWPNHESGEPFGENVKEAIHTAKNTLEGQLAEWKDQASHQANEWKEGSRQTIEEGKKYLQEQVTAARGEFSHFLDRNPLAVGAVMLALGAAVAASLPGTRKEDQWMGDSRDQMLKTIKTTVQSTVKDVKEQSGQIAEKVFQEAEQKVDA